MAGNAEVVEVTYEGAVATIWLSRPEARNALGRAFWLELPRATAQIAGDHEVRAVVLGCRGDHFTVGLDLKELGGDLLGASATGSSAVRASHRLAQVRAMQGAISSLAHLPVPVIAGVGGYCLGGGVDLVTACDIRLAAADAVFSVRETRMAIVADLGTLQRLPRIVGPAHAAELIYTGVDIDAARAAEIGLVNRVTGATAADAVTAAQELAATIAGNSPLAVRGSKAVLQANDGRTVDEGLDFVARWSTLFLESDDLREALSAFLERRPPSYSGQ